MNVPRPHNKEMSEKLWTNNNAESINHVFKIAVNWKPQSTPELMNKLYDCVDIQFHQTSEEKNDIFNSFLHDKK